MPRFSFIVPVYNCRQYLEECVRSILAQTVSDFEILLVDDGSADGSGELCDRLAEKDPRVHAYHKANGGAASARNLGIEKAGGDFVLFVDCDDTVEEELLKTVEPYLDDPGSLPVYGMSFDYWDDAGGLVKTELYCAAFPGSHELTEAAEKLPAFFEDNVFSSACNKVFSLKLLREKGLRFREHMRLYEDLEFVLRCLRSFERIQVIGRGLYHYRHRIGDAHLDNRVEDLSRVKADLAPLNRAFHAFGERTGMLRTTASVSADLYIAMLEWHLLKNKPGEAELRMSLPEYAAEEGFRMSLGDGAELDPAKKELIALIDAGSFAKIRRKFTARRLKLALKRAAKRLLGR